MRRRLRIVELSSDLVVQAMVTGAIHHQMIVKGIPKDSIIRNVTMGKLADTVELLIESQEFSEVGYGQEPPIICLTGRRYPCEQPELT